VLAGKSYGFFDFGGIGMEALAAAPQNAAP
jgi:hypothetical protein